jgi:signal transduction histidine kinase
MSRFPRRADATVFTALVLVCVLGVVTALVGSVAQVGRIFPGFIVWDNLVVVVVGSRTWTGIVADVPFRARVTRVDGRDVATRGALLDVVEAAPEGTVHTYEFATEHGPERRAVGAMRFSARDWLATFGVLLVNGLAFVAIGLAVFWLQPDSRQSRAVLAFGVAWGLMLILCLDLFTAGRLDPVYFVMQALCPAALVHLALTFPETRRVALLRPSPIAAVYALALVVGVADAVLYRRASPLQLVVDDAVWLVVAATGALAMLSIAHGAWRGSSSLARRRARVVLTGALAAFLLPLVAMLAFFLADLPVSVTFLIATGFVFPLAIGYAVVRHDLFEADRIVKQSLVYGATTAVVSLAYGATVLGAERLAAGLVVTRSPLFTIGFVMVVLATIVPLRDRVQRAVDRLFARGHADYKATVARASEQLTTLLDREAIARLVVTTVADVLFIDRASLWERTADGLVYRGGTLRDGAARRFAVDDPGLRHFEAGGRLLTRDEVEESSRLRDARASLRALFDALDAELLAPLRRGDAPAGILAVGGKTSGGPLTSDDVDVLTTLADQSALALANAAAVEALAEARDRLVRSERLAAMGELSAAVAHGIRNPLAGIRLAAQLALESAAPADPVRENLGDVLTEVEKLEARVRGVLDFARPFEPRLQATDVRGVVTSAIQTLAAPAATHGVTIAFDPPASLPPVLGDAAHLGQVVQEVLTNGIEALGDGGRITVTTAPAGDDGARRVRIEIADDGPGVAPELRERIFQLFMTTKATGTGVGLAVAKKIVERHGGTIAITDNVPRGTRFTIDLPSAQGAI